jgi:hypothetical protein
MFLNTPQQQNQQSSSIQIQSPTSALLNDLQSVDSKPIITTPESPIELINDNSNNNNNNNNNSNVNMIITDQQINDTQKNKLVFIQFCLLCVRR